VMEAATELARLIRPAAISSAVTAAPAT
jgi:hypothetical protein